MKAIQLIGLALGSLIVAAACSPINPSVDKKLPAKESTVVQPGIGVVKFRNASDDSDSLTQGEQDSTPETYSVALTPEQLAEFKADGKLKIPGSGMRPDEKARFLEAHFIVTDHALELRYFQITVQPNARDEWVVAIHPKADPVVVGKILPKLESLNLFFEIVKETANPKKPKKC